ncbi:MAG: TIGR00730 family Rossman fold protein [Phycisphaerae bacterium]|nr:TIGR00730 family Rossman fold protein [Phycisphaerae bacterium]
MSQPHRLCVFCGASLGARPEYEAAARGLGGILADRGITLVYGGGNAGLMGAVANGALAKGGQVIGIITRFLKGRELAHEGITELRVTETMHERKAMMATLADAFVALPGGYGTFDEFFEIMAWAQLGIHSKPVGLLNTAGYYDSLITFLDHADRESFLRLKHRSGIAFHAEASELLDQLASRVVAAS